MNDDTLVKAQDLKDAINELTALHASWWNMGPTGTRSPGDSGRIEVDGQVWATAVHSICADLDAKRQAKQAEYAAL